MLSLGEARREADDAARVAHWRTELAKAPQKARAKRNPLEKDPDAAAAGRNLFEQHCAECHGDLAEHSFNFQHAESLAGAFRQDVAGHGP